MEKEIKNLLNCGYYDECHNYIVELNETKMKDFFKKIFNADIIIFHNKDVKISELKNKSLIEKMKEAEQIHQQKYEELKQSINKFEQKADEEKEELRKKYINQYNELKENSKMIIKGIAEFL